MSWYQSRQKSELFDRLSAGYAASYARVFFKLNVQVSTVRKAKCSGRSRSDSDGRWVMAWREMVQSELVRRGHSSSGGEVIWSRQRHWKNVGQAWRRSFTSFPERFAHILENFFR